MKKIMLICALFIFAYSQNVQRTFNFNYSINLEATNNKKLELWVPIPQSNEVQSITNIKIDVGLNDEFLDDLFIDDFQAICNKVGQKLYLNKHQGYDHGYYFIQSFMKDHIEYHSSILKN